MITAIFLVSVAGVCASDANDTAIASDDSNQMELSSDSEISEDNLQIGEENSILTQNDDETLSAESDSQTLGAGEGTYSDLRNDIANGGSLTKSNYTYTDGDGDTIEITTPNMTINGNGAVIDMAGAGIRAFYVSASGITIKNLTIKNANYNADKGGAIYFSSSGTVENCNFSGNAGKKGGVIYMCGGSVSNCNFVDNSASTGGAIYFFGDGTVTNCNFINNTASSGDGGAVFLYYEGIVENCNFTNNKATTYVYANGGAIYFSRGIVKNCNFTNNSASYGGGAFYIGYGNAAYCNFTNNHAKNGGAIYSYSSSNTATFCNFTNNQANNKGGAMYGGAADTYTCIFKTGSDTTENTQLLAPILTVDNFTTVYGSGEKLTFVLKTNSGMLLENANISISIYYKDNDSWVGNYRCLSGEGWVVDLPAGLYYAIYDAEYFGFQEVNRTITINKIQSDLNVSDVTLDYGTSTNVTVTTHEAIGITAKIDVDNATVVGNTIMIPSLDVGTYLLTVTTIVDSNHLAATKTAKIFVNKINTQLVADPITLIYNTGGDLTVTLKDVRGNPLANQDLLVYFNGAKTFDLTDLNGTIKVPVNGLAPNTYSAEIVFDGNGIYNESKVVATVTVNKDGTSLSADAVTAVYNVNKNLLITLKDSRGNPIKGAAVTVDLNGAKTYATDSNGQIKVPTKGLAAKAYTAKITFNSNANYDKSAKDVKVTVKKATPILTAKKATLKAKTKTKKYAVTLKDNTGKAMNKVQITLKVKGKTYKATTNAKGKATFKIKKLTKKGTYKSTVTFKGNSNYNKITKTVKITVK